MHFAAHLLQRLRTVRGIGELYADVYDGSLRTVAANAPDLGSVTIKIDRRQIAGLLS
jgi:hypothetical protein